MSDKAVTAAGKLQQRIDDLEYDLKRMEQINKENGDYAEKLQAQMAVVRVWYRKWAGMCIDLESEQELLAAIGEVGDG